MTKRVTETVWWPERIVSGGQTGVDRGALDAAIALGIAHGGWCPRGRLAEDGSVPSRYDLEELGSSNYTVRTEQNVIDSDATLILYERRLGGGTLLTHRLTQKWDRPCWVIRIDQTWDIDEARNWLNQVRPPALNIAGPRESTCPGIQERSESVLLKIFAIKSSKPKSAKKSRGR